ncbi:MAG: hypothetical protein DRP11_01245 [Candidatus Aenigmatarchaeota archaeon]|nr:MAG: hypothetical protein DRP11_01245 [Candidatus Aenigmarchaeota archaeon]
MVKVSVIITAHNYGRYLRECLNSVLRQTFDDYEIVVVDDGSTDETPQILEEYVKKYPEKIKVVRLNGLGLPTACNHGIKASCGEYIIRLDADDFFDENILLIESTILDKNPDIDLVYPDYYEVDADGNIKHYKRLMRVNDEVKLLHRSPLAAGAMFRRRCYDEIGGYNESLKYQEDYDFWLRFTSRFKVYNVNLPLLYYRRHGANMSKNFKGRMEARRVVKEEFVKKHLKEKLENLKVLGLIPARRESRLNGESIALTEVAGKPLIAYTIEEALKSKNLDRVVVSTEDEEIARVARRYGAEVLMRPEELARRGVPVENVVKYTLEKLEREGYEPDIVVLLHVVSPLKKRHHIDEAVNTMLIFDMDSVISVTPDIKFHWKPGMYGLVPLFEKRLLKDDRETLYLENGAIYASKSDVWKSGRAVGNKVGHILMSEDESIHIDSEYDLWLVEQLIKSGRHG